MNTLFTIVTIGIFLNANAFALDINSYSSEEIIVHESTGEMCIIPQHLSDSKYKEKDTDKEMELCQVNFGVTHTVCPKTHSTNPAGEIFPLGTDCELAPKGKLAKYKVSTSCSYTPSILAYYHFSRLFGGILNVPVAVVHTMDLEAHKQIARQGMLIPNDDSLLHLTFEQLLAKLNAGKSPALITSDGKYSYGALVYGVKGESFYKEMFHKGADRAQAFKERNPYYLKLIDSRPISEIVPFNFNIQNAQNIKSMEDVSNMLVLDFLLSQQDRFGNIAFEPMYYKFDKERGLQKSKKPEKGFVMLKEMVLKDNDCGVNKLNVVKQADLLTGLQHLSFETYKNLLKLKQYGRELKPYLKVQLQFTDRDYENLIANINELSRIMVSKCEEGTLKLDLNFKTHFSSELTETSCHPSLGI